MDKETSEIAKLTERISKDPKSKLFVPLAEEYKKAGDIEMAIYVLSEGLKNNPGYVTARSILGKLLLEKGDLAGSQKEFEEVVKAIPDNLLAQRKLGDLCALQNRPDEALKHYKTVLSLNPRDAELASLVSDLEAGRDIRPRLHLLKSQTSPEKAGRQETPAASPPRAQSKAPAMPVRAPAVATTPASPQPAMPTGEAGPEEAKTEKRATTSMPPKGVLEATAQTETTSSPVSLKPKEEEPEEVLAVEPLEETVPEPESSAPVFDFLTEREHETMPGPPAEEHAETLFPAGRQVEGQTVSSHVFPTEEIVKEKGAEEPSPAAVDIQREVDIVEAEIVKESASESQEPVLPAEALGDVSEKSDDFTTDTLAELYIAQGFYEKAIDIYERMLADKPASRGLKEKLERVRSMAAHMATAETIPAEEAKESKEAEMSIFAEASEFVPPVEAEETVIETEIPAEPGEYRPAPEKEEHAEPGKSTGFDVFASFPAREYVPQSEPFSTEFEPREYVPPKAEQEPSVVKAESVHAAPRTSKASKKETIDRLEAWLQNIKKEK